MVVFFFIALQIWALEYLLSSSKKGDLRRRKFPRILHWQDVKVGSRQIEVASKEIWLVIPMGRYMNSQLLCKIFQFWLLL